VLAAAAGTARSALVESALGKGLRVCALSADLKARAVDDDGWVELLEQHVCQAWLWRALPAIAARSGIAWCAVHTLAFAARE